MMPPTPDDADKITQFQRLAQSSSREAAAAQAAGDLPGARAWAERAHRLAPQDAAISLTLASLHLRCGQPDAALRLLDALAATQDRREVWLALAAARHAVADAPGAAQALAAALSGHVLPDWPGLDALAGAITRANGAANGVTGWCGIAPDGRARVSVAGAVVLVDGALWPADAVLPQTGRFAALLGQTSLLGGVADLAVLHRLVGLVQDRDGLAGWAWYPRNPDADPVLWVCDARGRRLRVVAADQRAQAAQALDRPRRFQVPRAALQHMTPPLRVVDGTGQALAGSPIDPFAGQRAAMAAARSVARAWPLNPAARPVLDRLTPAPAAETGPPAHAAAQPDRPVVVVVPVYGDAAATRICLRSVLAALPDWASLLVVDDAAPDAELAAMLDRLAGQGRLTLLRHAENQGFPAAVNTGLRAVAGQGGADVILLNSDTVVASGWIAGLRAAVHAAADIATATPLSNDAGFVSFPDPRGGNPMPADLPALARLAARIGTAPVDVPTGVGFCLYIRREALAQVGLLRAGAFGTGYGEENDFCLRARHLGWRHIVVPRVFVAHRGGASFGDRRPAQMMAHLARLETLYPGYHALVAGFLAADTLAPARHALALGRLQAGGGRASVLLVTHDQGGGVARAVAARAEALRAQGLRPLLLLPSPGGVVLAEHPHAPRAVRFPLAAAGGPGLADLAAGLRALRPAWMEVHHLHGHHPDLVDLARRLGIPADWHVHDYAAICPRVTLVGPQRRYCGEPTDIAACESCIDDAGRADGRQIGVAALRQDSAQALLSARRVVVPSADAARRLRRHIPGLTVAVQPLDHAALTAPFAPPQGARRRVCVIGGLGVDKGYDVLLACARDAVLRDLALEFVLVGGTDDDDRLLATGRCWVTGRYHDDAAVALVRAQAAQLALLPSIWPETWCYTLGIAWQAGLRAAVFDLGALAERVRAGGAGWVLPLGLAPGAINQALLTVDPWGGDR